MSDRYPGGFLTNATPTVSTSSATGIWTPEQQLGYQAQGQWPVPPAGPVQVDRSLRFNSADSTYLNRTPGSASNRKTWTWSGWVKKTTNGGDYKVLFEGYNSTTSYCALNFTDSDQLRIDEYSGLLLLTNAVYRDLSAWYHIVYSIDTTQATSSNRVKIYVNGQQVTSFATSTYPSQNYDTQINNSVSHSIGQNLYPGYPQSFNGYMANIDFIDGQALDPSYFGQTNATTGVWEPIQTVGYLTYGTNGFHLDFADNTSTTTIGYDTSGNGNNWTANNFSVTAGTGNDSLVDTPTPYGTDTGVGGEVGGNYATWNPLQTFTSNTYANGNLETTTPTTTTGPSVATIGVSSGKWYWEVTWSGSGTLYGEVGVVDTVTSAGYLGDQATGYSYDSDARKIHNGTITTGYGSTYTFGDVIGVALDMDAGTLTFYKNGSSQGQAFSGLSGNFKPAVGDRSNSVGAFTAVANFGQRPFAYTAPSGHKALCTTNLPAPDVVQGDQNFAASIYTGNNSTNTITNSGEFQPDFIWFKDRSRASSYVLIDSIRGVTKALDSSSAFGDTAYTFNNLTSINSNGFTLSANTTTDAFYVNLSGDAFVAWQWKGGGSGVSNTDGSIASTVSANPTAGFSVVTYTGTGANASVGHGLGVTPSWIIIKRRNDVGDWQCFGNTLFTRMQLNTTGADDGNYGLTFGSSTFAFNTSLPADTDWNGSGSTYVAYCFAAVEGFSAFGKYTGNGSTDGPFVYTGFRPAFVLGKRSDAANGWFMFDGTRDPYNVTDAYLAANASAAEATFTFADFTSNGFKLRATTSDWNGSGGTVIYMAFAENPFKYSLAR